MSEPAARVVLRVRTVNGEHPEWDERRQCLWFVDMRAPALHRYIPADDHHDWWQMPAWVGSFGLCEDGRLVLALRTGVHQFDPETGSIRFLAAAPYDARRFCFNDGRCDRSGHLVLGAMYHPLPPFDTQGEAAKAAPLWRLSLPDHLAPLDLPAVHTANGLAFSPDGRTLYHSDTPAKTIWACDYDPASGQASGRRVFAEVPEGGPQCGPDGAIVDSDGCYICAVFGAGLLLRFTPQGQLERRIEVPVRYPTMPALGGPGLDVLYVTSASYPYGEPCDHPDAGSVVALPAPAPGLPTNYLPGIKEPRP